MRKVGSNRRQFRLVLAAITALKNVGDAGVIPVIEKVAGLRAWTEDGECVVRFALDALQTLRRRAEQSAISQTLLRPADSLLEPTELLHVAIPSESNPDELLRVSFPKPYQSPKE